MIKKDCSNQKPNSTRKIDKLLNKWREDSKKIKHYDLIKTIIDESGYSQMLKNKKDIENENRLENIKS